MIKGTRGTCLANLVQVSSLRYGIMKYLMWSYGTGTDVRACGKTFVRTRRESQDAAYLLNSFRKAAHYG